MIRYLPFRRTLRRQPGASALQPEIGRAFDHSRLVHRALHVAGYCTRARTKQHDNAPGAHRLPNAYTLRTRISGNSVPHAPATAEQPARFRRGPAWTCRPFRPERTLCFLQSGCGRSSSPVISYFRFGRTLHCPTAPCSRSRRKHDAHSNDPCVYTCSRCTLQQFATLRHARGTLTHRYRQSRNQTTRTVHTSRTLCAAAP